MGINIKNCVIYIAVFIFDIFNKQKETMIRHEDMEKTMIEWDCVDVCVWAIGNKLHLLN